ncbi:uncharacterized protein LOC117921334 isoform X2 [Vitis riparia]|uniref:uncharacterized protein LOC117921334 isoform X2 n=1 Tax=Vitis riparia TaxID=96939 RepID=UPI00155B3420|nr:uncharacterized protein LOC117921334 isoform X2 [Vitis riparia]
MYFVYQHYCQLPSSRIFHGENILLNLLSGGSEHVIQYTHAHSHRCIDLQIRSTMMVNPRRISHPNTISNQTSETLTPSLSSLFFFLKRPQAFPFLLSIFLLLTWLSLRLQRSSLFNSPPNRNAFHTLDHDREANLVRFSSHFFTDKRGWLLNPISAASDASISGGAVNCASVHIGEIRPGGMRGNHRHHGCNETFIIWGAKTAFRLENHQVPEKGYAEVIIGANEVAVAASPSGTAHALINIDPIRTAFFMGCQDSIINYNSSATDFKVWKDL